VSCDVERGSVAIAIVNQEEMIVSSIDFGGDKESVKKE
jgi:hypothetical protein